MRGTEPSEDGTVTPSTILKGTVGHKSKKAMESIAPMLQDFTPKTSSSENTSLKLPPSINASLGSEEDDEDVGVTLQRTLSHNSQYGGNSHSKPPQSPRSGLSFLDGMGSGSDSVMNSEDSCDPVGIDLDAGTLPISSSGMATPHQENSNLNLSSSVSSTPSTVASSRKGSFASAKLQLPKIGKIGVCAMDTKVLSKPCRRILNRLIENGEFETIIFGDKVILDENIENWPTCDFLISFFSTGFPLDKAINYVKLRKPYIINDLIMQKALWDRRLCLRLLETAEVPTPYRLEISRDGGPVVDNDLRGKLIEKNVKVEPIKEPKWRMVDADTLEVDGKIITKPYVEKPVDGEDHNIYIYYHSKNGGGGRRLFRKVGNKSSEFDPTLDGPRTEGSFIYEEFMDTNNFEDVKAYTVGDSFCHAETRKSPVVDGIVRRNTHGKEVRYITELSDEEKDMAAKVCRTFSQMICGFDLLRVGGKSYVIDVNGFSFVKDNMYYYDQCTKILRELFIEAKKKIDAEKKRTHFIQEEKTQKWVFKGLVTVIRHADRTPKQKLKHSFTSPLFISLLKGHKEEVVIRKTDDLKIVLKALQIALEDHEEDPVKLKVLHNALQKKLEFPGTKIQLKPVLTKEKEVEKVQFILKWGGEPTHSARYQARDLGEQMRQDFDLLNKSILQNIKIFSSSERRVLLSAQIWASALFSEDELGSDEINIRRDLLDDSNAAKDLMDKVKKKLKSLIRVGTEIPPQFAWPPKMPDPYTVTKRVVDLMNYHRKVLNYNFTKDDVDDLQSRWCCGEDPMLFKERWEKLFKEFENVEKLDPSKISELYDSMKYDALHNRDFLAHIFDPGECQELLKQEICNQSLVDSYPINVLAKNNFKIVEGVPKHNATPTSPRYASSVGSLGWVLESSKTSSSQKSEHSSLFDEPRFLQFRELFKLTKVLFDFICPKEYGITDSEKLDIGLLTSLPLANQILNDIDGMKNKEEPACISYFTKESHIYTLLNIIYESGIPMRIARNALPEFDYLSQINFELYESTDNSGQKSHSIRLKMSPGCHTQDPLDVQLDDKHYISCIPKISLTKHLDMDYVQQKLRNKFSRVNMPKKFTPVNITSPNLLCQEHEEDYKKISFVKLELDAPDESSQSNDQQKLPDSHSASIASIDNVLN
ncbi:hypothetical protein Kpol_1055p63 [Vanderwaltozyma polyspora DSM 70294]|uniref:Inositol hexakisphosphate and diphosphoinositol-pentakisphosphate kinase n=1 Tax=Vanderwaltozyma polyspora (strain ATCC 22028 / DSM 70294 / BCRC 21397 / CBS 2163 / NBRC 10782 / NRRL Y-8283 / UCD 57-17) TaxID=436907 RepID=A7TGD6_VANPO|nr:uncharacterized protein Kpol_1055p63 [Vanderwaltozyma polyspora DSM 70294]EDO18706.1 hypothetical protein Kpol_1055p63 [Vanderwaltozyma polyspora DSM 70294]